MERLVLWWCALIGVTDEQAIHIAVGVVAAGLLLAVPGFTLSFVREFVRAYRQNSN
jgi:hypothetical protein